MPVGGGGVGSTSTVRTHGHGVHVSTVHSEPRTVAEGIT